MERPDPAGAGGAPRAIELRDVPFQMWSPARSMTFSRVLDGGRVHAFVGDAQAVWSVLQYATGRAVPSSGSVTIGGALPDAKSIPFQMPEHPKPPTWWQRLLRRQRRDTPRIDSLEHALAVAPLVFVGEPFALIDDAERERVVRAVRGARGRGATVLLSVRTVRDALPLADVVHLFSRNGDPLGFGDLETVLRPDVGEPLSPDAICNPLHGAVVAELDGVRVPVAPRGYEMAVDSFSSGHGFIAWHRESWWHVPARRVVLDPPFSHGAPSGSPDLTIPSGPPIRRGVVVAERPDPGPLDLTARWVVLDGKVTDRVPVGDRVRLTVSTARGHQLHVDLPPGVTDTQDTVRVGFDSAHVMS